MAHLLEHLVFKGTPKHPNIPQELTAHGSRPNGTTWTDRTNYFETFSATDENLEWALDLEADRMVNSFIAKKDLDSEMTVVRNEFEMGENDPFSVLLGTHHVDRVSLAQLREDDHRRAVGHRERADRSAAGVLQAVLPAGQRRPAGRRQVRRSRRRSRSSTSTSRRSRNRPARWSGSTPSSRRRTASAPSRCGASGTRSSSTPCTTCRPARTRISPPSTSSPRCSATRPRAGCTRRWSSRRKRPAPTGSTFSGANRRSPSSARKSGRARRSTPPATRCCRRSKA